MGSSDNFCLRWNDFESNISTSFRELRDDSEFFDVTLCCDNGTDIVPAHKVILAACSPLFRKILSRQKNQQNPFLYLKGIHLKEMKAVLNFMYHGEVNVAQDSLNNFLAVAEELAVKGLTTDSKPAGTDTPAKKAVVSQKQKRSLPPGSSSSTPQAAKKPKPSQSNTPSEDIEIEPHLEDVDIKSIKAEPEPSGSGSGGPGGSHAAMVEADLGDESYGASGADGDDNGDFGAEGEFEGFDQYGEGNEFDDSMGAAGGSGAAADGKGSLKLTLKMDTDKDLSQAFGIRTTHELPPHEFKVEEKVYKTGKKAGQSHVTSSLSIFPYEFKKRTERGQLTYFTCNGCDSLGQSNCAKAKKISWENNSFSYELVSWPLQHFCTAGPDDNSAKSSSENQERLGLNPLVNQ